ncbi:glycosyltransferase [Halosquirtibacter laminarini]|uniref:Glycosyltransferase n=1 Tax=Halosquirtibacter laminarini TaxID=3374600 RepID=A0AC61ND55_9BACT|nr:glycosyltransferase [Prolixibacteraceae bacterium]
MNNSSVKVSSSIDIKFLIVGDFAYDIYEESLRKSFHGIVNEIYSFPLGPYYDYITHPSINRFKFTIENVLKFCQIKFRYGRLIKKINDDLVDFISENQVDIVFLYRPILIKGETLRRIKRTLPNIKIITYNNDCAFSNKYPWYFWRLYHQCCRESSLNLAYRYLDLKFLQQLSIDSSLFLPSFSDHIYPIIDIQDNYKSDVVFIGHFEDDGRDYYLVELLRKGYNLRIFGTKWSDSKYYKEICSYLGYKIIPVYKNEYNLYLNGAKIALVFLSKLNNDRYTRRNFEIPMTNTLMLSVFSKELACELFKEGQHIVFFNDLQSLMSKIDFYLEHEDERNKIVSDSYYWTCNNHSMNSRVNSLMKKIKSL